jgi:hypothetical protein
MPTQWIDFKHKKIIYVDYSNLSGDEMLPVLHELEEEAKKSAEKILILINFTDSFSNANFLEEVKRVGKETTEKKAIKTAIVGVGGLKNLLLKAYNAFTGVGVNQRLFNDIEDAKKWLVE